MGRTNRFYTLVLGSLLLAFLIVPAANSKSIDVKLRAEHMEETEMASSKKSADTGIQRSTESILDDVRRAKANSGLVSQLP
ncbi:MAG: hypothetical protein HOI80_06275 [Alphaproteobacteria bacterium]|nr:hypothetical protein [Alphaproteobacteria bacterium]MBT5390314.1 hypothetical protein [Alphaproteobacteria bacterium]MBT5540115.1 hypothetical protein [Alphaproteobacteria bacterium]MBT5655080.1 hypothetical protein [Alphaproteobacteria bacterium]